MVVEVGLVPGTVVTLESPPAVRKTATAAMAAAAARTITAPQRRPRSVGRLARSRGELRGRSGEPALELGHERRVGIEGGTVEEFAVLSTSVSSWTARRTPAVGAAQERLGGPDRPAEQPGDLRHRQVVDVAQHERGPLVGRQGAQQAASLLTGDDCLIDPGAMLHRRHRAQLRGPAPGRRIAAAGGRRGGPW